MNLSNFLFNYFTHGAYADHLEVSFDFESEWLWSGLGGESLSCVGSVLK